MTRTYLKLYYSLRVLSKTGGVLSPKGELTSSLGSVSRKGLSLISRIRTQRRPWECRENEDDTQILNLEITGLLGCSSLGVNVNSNEQTHSASKGVPTLFSNFKIRIKPKIHWEEISCVNIRNLYFVKEVTFFCSSKI